MSTSCAASVPTDHVGLYIHIPFCARKCRYCDFPSRPPCDQAEIDRYLDALCAEGIRACRSVDRPLHSIYVGGGTPSMLSPAQWQRLWNDVIAPFPRLPSVEFSVEANPGTLTPALATAFAGAGVTRVSLGAQSLHADELARLGRIHCPEAVEESVRMLRAAGTFAVNLDLMYALPGQTTERWRDTLRRALALAPDHLSCYALIVEEETPLSADLQAGIYTLPREEEEEAMTAVMDEMLPAAGYQRYEVSNAARDGAWCRHNLGYWLGRDYLGLGAAAASTWGTVRWRNCADVGTYLTRALDGLPVREYVERLSAPRRLLERVMLGLRLRTGFDLANAETACGCRLDAVTGSALDTLYASSLLERNGDCLRLTPEGFPLANQVMTRLLAACDARRCDH